MFDEPVAVRLQDKSGNLFYQDRDGVPPPLELCVETGLLLGADMLKKSYAYRGILCQFTIPDKTCEVCTMGVAVWFSYLLSYCVVHMSLTFTSCGGPLNWRCLACSQFVSRLDTICRVLLGLYPVLMRLF